MTRANVDQGGLDMTSQNGADGVVGLERWQMLGSGTEVIDPHLDKDKAFGIGSRRQWVNREWVYNQQACSIAECSNHLCHHVTSDTFCGIRSARQVIRQPHVEGCGVF